MKNLCFLLLGLFMTTAVLAQEPREDEDEEFRSFQKERKFDRSKISIGSGIGSLYFSQDVFIFGLPTIVTFKLHERVHVGAGPIYEYNRVRNPVIIDNQIVYPYELHGIGSRALVRGFVWESLFLQLEGLFQHVRYKVDGDPRQYTNDFGNVFVGAGYYMEFGNRGYAAPSIRLNLIENRAYLRRTPTFQFEIGFNL